LPDVGEIRRVYAGIRSMEVVNIWCDSVGKIGIYRPKPRWGISFKIFGYPGSETTGPIKKIRGSKNGTVITYLHAEFGRDPPLHGGARKKSWEFLFFPFVTLWILNLNKRLAHQMFSHSNSDSVVICRSISMRISTFFKDKCSFKFFKRHLNYAARWCHICLRN